jgi:hypothetical protein
VFFFDLKIGATCCKCKCALNPKEQFYQLGNDIYCPGCMVAASNMGSSSPGHGHTGPGHAHSGHGHGHDHGSGNCGKVINKNEKNLRVFSVINHWQVFLMFTEMMAEIIVLDVYVTYVIIQ